jgi:hypothetical protein
MKSRETAPLHALSRIVTFVDTDDRLRAAAAESKALELLRGRIEALRITVEKHADLNTEIRFLDAQRGHLRRTLTHRLELLAAAASIAVELEPHLSPLTKVPPYADAIAFAVLARSITVSASEFIDVLVGSGFQRSILDEIPLLADALQETAHRRSSLAATRRAIPDRFASDLEPAYKLVNLLRLQLEAAMSPALAAEWGTLSALGRGHRSKPTLGAPPRRPLLGPGGDSAPAEPTA